MKADAEKLRLFTGRANPLLAQKICDYLQIPLGRGKTELFPDGEVIVKHGPVGQMNAERSQHWEVKGATFAALRDAIKRAGLPCFAAVDAKYINMNGRIMNDRGEFVSAHPQPRKPQPIFADRAV